MHTKLAATHVTDLDGNTLGYQICINEKSNYYQAKAFNRFTNILLRIFYSTLQPSIVFLNYLLVSYKCLLAVLPFSFTKFFNFVIFFGSLTCTLNFKVFQRFSIGFRSWGWLGNSSTLIQLSLNYFIILKLCALDHCHAGRGKSAALLNL